VEGNLPAIPEPLCRPTPLEGSEPVTAPAAGIVVFHAQPGDRVSAGDRIADIVDPLTGAVTPALTASDGVLYARVSTRFARAGERLGKVAGTSLQRSGKLLSA
jgi:predicted deacylase